MYPRVPPQGSPLASYANEHNEPNRLQPELDRLQNENQGRHIALLASNEHGALLQEKIDRLSVSLTGEVQERHTADLLEKFHGESLTPSSGGKLTSSQGRATLSGTEDYASISICSRKPSRAAGRLS